MEGPEGILMGTRMSLEATLTLVPPMSITRIFMLSWMLAANHVSLACLLRRRFRRLVRFHDGGADELIQFWKLAIEMGVAAFEHLVLVAGTHASTGVFSVATVEFLDDIHA